MPKPPRIQDPNKRERVIAIILALVLAASLLLTWLLTKAPLL